MLYIYIVCFNYFMNHVVTKSKDFGALVETHENVSWIYTIDVQYHYHVIMCSLLHHYSH